MFDQLNKLEDLIKYSQKIFPWLLLIYLFSYITILLTTDYNLTLNNINIPPPFANINLPIIYMYIIMPILLTVMDIFFLYHLIEVRKIYYQSRQEKHRKDSSNIMDTWFISKSMKFDYSFALSNFYLFNYIIKVISDLISWFLVPLTLIVMWFTFLKRHDLTISIIHLICIAISFFILFAYYNNPNSNPKRNSFNTSRVILAIIITVLLISLLSIITVYSISFEKSNFISRNLEKVGLKAYINVSEAQMSVKTANYDLINVDQRDSSVIGVDLKNRNLVSADMYKVFLVNSSFSNSDLRNVNLLMANLRSVFMYNANLNNASLKLADLTNADLRYAQLKNAKLTGAILENANLSNSDLESACMIGANLKNVNLKGANLENTNLIDANLAGANLLEVSNLSYYQLIRALIDSTTILPERFKNHLGSN